MTGVLLLAHPIIIINGIMQYTIFFITILLKNFQFFRLAAKPLNIIIIPYNKKTVNSPRQGWRGVTTNLGQKILRITFRLYMTFWPAYKAIRSIAAGQNVAEKNPTKAVGRLGFFGARGRYCARSIYRPVRRSNFCFCYFLIPILPVYIG
jgi:hypothetical protein